MDLAQLKQNRNLLFWSLHVLGWSGYGISQYVGALLYGKPVAYAQYIFVAAASGCVLSAPLRYICRWLWKQPPAVMIADSEESLKKPGATYPLPPFYKRLFNGLDPVIPESDKFRVHAERVGDYTISYCA